MAEKKHLTQKDINAVLPKETAEMYNIKDLGKRTSTVIFHGKFGRIDFSTLSVARAAQLVSLKADFIELKTKAK